MADSVLFTLEMVLLKQRKEERRAGAVPTWAIIALAALFPLVYMLLAFRYAFNIPSWDDFETVLAYLILPADERLSHLFAFHNEHRIAVSRVIIELLSLVYRPFDLRIMAIIGNCFVIGIYGLLAARLWTPPRRRLYLPALAMILFIPASWDNMVAAMASTSNFGVHFFCLAAITALYASRLGGWRFVVAIALTGVAVVTSGAGLFLPPAVIGVHVLLYLTDARESELRRSRLLIIAGAALFLLAAAALYFIDFSRPGHHPSMLDSLRDPLSVGLYGLAFLGSAAAAAGLGLVGSLALGLLFVGCFLQATLRRAWREHPVAYTFLAYLVVVAGVAALGRSGFGVEQAIDLRYRINSLLFGAGLCVLFVRMAPQLALRQRVLLPVSIALLGLFVISTVRANHGLRERRQEVIRATAAWLVYRTELHHHPSQVPMAGRLLDEAMRQGVYQPPPSVTALADQWRGKR